MKVEQGLKVGLQEVFQIDPLKFERIACDCGSGAFVEVWNGPDLGPELVMRLSRTQAENLGRFLIEDPERFSTSSVKRGCPNCNHPAKPHCKCSIPGCLCECSVWWAQGR